MSGTIKTYMVGKVKGYVFSAIMTFIIIIGVIAFYGFKSGYGYVRSMMADEVTKNGVLAEGGREQFKIKAYDSDVDLYFTQPPGADYWVHFTDSDGIPIGSWDLKGGTVFELEGDTRFICTIESRGGNGPWSCTYDP